MPPRPPVEAWLNAGSPAALAAREDYYVRAAARHAVRVFPGPIGELLARELCAHADFGLRSEDSGLLRNVAREVLAMPATGDAPPESSRDTFHPVRFPR